MNKHGLKQKKKNINRQLKTFYKAKFNISEKIKELEFAKERVNNQIAGVIK